MMQRDRRFSSWGAKADDPAVPSPHGLRGDRTADRAAVARRPQTGAYDDLFDVAEAYDCCLGAANLTQRSCENAKGLVGSAIAAGKGGEICGWSRAHGPPTEGQSVTSTKGRFSAFIRSRILTGGYIRVLSCFDADSP